MTTLILMRHGVAEDHAPGGDAARALTARGRERAAQAATGLVALGLAPDLVLCSPLVRCAQTAREVGGAAGCPVQHDDRLAPGMTTDALLDAVLEHPGAGVVLACSHQPGLSYALADLTGCGMIAFRRPGAAVVRMDAVRAGGGELVAVLPPRVLRAAGGA